MRIQHFSLVFILSGFLLLAVYYLLEMIYIHKNIFQKYINFVISCLCFASYIIFVCLLNFNFSEIHYSYFHKLKMVSALILISSLQLTLYKVYFTYWNKSVPFYYILLLPFVIAISTLDVFTMLPVRELILNIQSSTFVYHFGKTNIIYPFFALSTFLFSLISAIYYIFSKSNFVYNSTGGGSGIQIIFK